MREHTLNHTLSNNDGYGDHEIIIASQSNSAGTKKLILVLVISAEIVRNYFKIVKNGEIQSIALTPDGAREQYNNIC